VEYFEGLILEVVH